MEGFRQLWDSGPSAAVVQLVEQLLCSVERRLELLHWAL